MAAVPKVYTQYQFEGKSKLTMATCDYNNINNVKQQLSSQSKGFFKYFKIWGGGDIMILLNINDIIDGKHTEIY